LQVAMVELQVNENVPPSLLIAFTICTTLLVSVHMLALMISTCILPNVEAVASVHGLAAVSESPHEKMHFYIEIAWAFSTVFGIFLFLIELAILCWVKFWNLGGASNSGHLAALAATIVLIPIGIVFIGFAMHFYTTLVSHKYERSERGILELESLVSQLQSPNEADTSNRRQSAIINI
jgi:calcium release-activated calcium channel protein 1